MILDVVTGVILFLSMLIAWFRGFIREVLTIFGLIGAGIAALTGAPYAVPYTITWFPKVDAEGNEQLLFGIISYDIIAAGLSYLLIFIFVYIILSLCAHWLATTAKESGLGALDRSLGLLFGLTRAVVLIGLLFIPFHIFLDDDKDEETQKQKEAWFGDSITYPYVDYTARVMRAVIPNPLESEEGEDKGEDTQTSSEEGAESDKPLSLKDMLQKQAIESIMKTQDVLKDEQIDLEALKDLQNKEGYSDTERQAIEKLFEMQQNGSSREEGEPSRN
jgi:membrane protein required for colicin V production